MSIREAINRYPKVSAVAAGFVSAGAMVVACYTAFGSEADGVSAATRAYFSVDDGHSYFADDATKLSGFEHQGKPAYRAYVFTRPGSQPFVGYLERLDPRTRDKVSEMQARKKGAPDAEVAKLTRDAQQIKRPGEPGWRKRTSKDALAIINIKSPDGQSADIEPVLP